MKMKVRCVGYKTNERYFTIGKIYTWEDGRLTNDTGFTYSVEVGFVQGTDPNKWLLSDWYKFEKVDDDSTMTDKEIYDMLLPKFEKNRSVFNGYAYLDEVVALAYKCGYMRAMKGRPFKYGDKKVDNEN